MGSFIKTVSCLQPQNILLTGLSPLGDIKIVDFGLARRLGAVGELREILGTPEYVGELVGEAVTSSSSSRCDCLHTNVVVTLM